MVKWKSGKLEQSCSRKPLRLCNADVPSNELYRQFFCCLFTEANLVELKEVGITSPWKKKTTSSSTQYKRGGEPMLLPLLAYTSSKTKNRVEDIWMTSPHPLNTAMTSPTAPKLVQGTAIHQDKSRINPGYLLSSQPQFQRSHSQTRAESSSFSSSRMNPQLSETHCATTCILTL